MSPELTLLEIRAYAPAGWRVGAAAGGLFAVGPQGQRVDVDAPRLTVRAALELVRRDTAAGGV